jgi:quinolinate synthase
MNIVEKIQQLKKERNAVILVHNYQLPEIQDIADFTGDSLGLSIQASKTQADLIVFCGVYFMAETAKIISPEKTVVIPEREAGCPMADMITVSQLQGFKKEHPHAKTLCYVNTSAEVKAECDMCCTSANAVDIINKAFSPKDKILFVPDKYLAGYAKRVTGRDIVAWPGYCPTHARILSEQVFAQKRLHPKAKILAHPECNKEVLDLADEILSTEGMIRYAQKSPAREMIVATEKGMIYRLKKENPDKEFYPASEDAVCPNMKMIDLPKVLRSLEDVVYKVELKPGIIEKASLGIKKMLEFTA